MESDTILKRSADTTFEVVADEAILIDLNSGAYFSLNKVGSQFWEMLDGQRTIAQHANILAEQYNVDVATVTADLLELTDKMAADNLVRAANE